MPWVARYPWGGIQSAAGDLVPPASIYTQEFARTSGWVWEDPIGTPRPDLAPGPVPQPPGGFAYQPYQPPAPVTPGAGATDAATQNATARAKTAQLLYDAMRGLPFISEEYLAALQGGQTPAPRTMTPQTLAALANDEFLSSNFFSLLEAAGLYPTSFLAEAGRFQPRGAQAAPSFI